jgi:hypothetical protein
MLEVGVTISTEVRPFMFGHPYLDKKVKNFVNVTEAGSLFTTLLFQPNLTNWTNKLECLPLASLSIVVLCSTVAYWVNW